MKRGLIRSISGIMLIAVQVLTLGHLSALTDTNPGIMYSIGLFSPAIVGAILLFFGSRAWRNDIYSELILHSKNKKIHTVMKWIGFALSTLLFIFYLVSIALWSDFSIITILYLFGFLSFSVYTLFYMYKKPSCLFSATLVFVGVVHVYAIIDVATFYVWYTLGEDYFILYVFMKLLPTLLSGILYITIASIIHTERFSVKVVKVLGWIVFALEILDRVISRIVIWKSIDLGSLVNILHLLFAIVLMLYMSVFKVNTLRGASADVTDGEAGYWDNSRNFMTPTNVPEWQCSCGRAHPSYETSCVCGKSKFDNKIVQPQPNAAAEVTDKIRFCRKCGEKLIDGSRFCSKCGTQVVEKMSASE